MPARTRRGEQDPYRGFLDEAGVPGLRMRRMFGCWAYYADERLVWVSAARRPPWRGILLPTERHHHAALRSAMPALRRHPVLGKWLYLPAADESFEATAEALARRVAVGDARVGVAPARRLVPSRRRRAAAP